MEQFGQILKFLRTKNNYTQTDLANLFNVTKVTIHAWENNKQEPSIDRIITLCKIFNVTPNYLLGFENSNKYINMEFTKRFNEVLQQDTINQTLLAKRLNISKQAITNLKSGTSLPSLDLLCKISKVLNYSTDYLLGLEDESGRKTYNITNNINDNHGTINQTNNFH